MGLYDSVLKFIGRDVHVHPVYGWGWCQQGKPYPVPNPFAMKITSFWEIEGERRGGIGRVEAATHELSGRWVTFSTRTVGMFDFEDHSGGSFNISTNPHEPVSNVEGWPMASDRCESISGYGHIVALGPDVACELCEQMAPGGVSGSLIQKDPTSRASASHRRPQGGDRSRLPERHPCSKEP